MTVTTEAVLPVMSVDDLDVLGGLLLRSQRSLTFQAGLILTSGFRLGQGS